jgi:hypothetical protein
LPHLATLAPSFVQRRKIVFCAGPQAKYQVER